MLIKEIISESEKIAPLAYSLAAVEKGYYDNSGLLVGDDAQETTGVLFALDLNKSVLNLTKELGVKLIFTHHPAIYKPIKNINGVLADCLNNGICVYSAHLNLDIACGGIEDGLCAILGAKNPKTCEYITENCGFGREFEIEPISFKTLVAEVSAKLQLNNYMVFGNGNRVIKKVASFCGAGLDESSAAQKNDVDLLVSADISHHVLLAALENDKCVLQLTHYTSEAFAFESFAKKLCENLKIKAHFYFDERFL